MKINQNRPFTTDEDVVSFFGNVLKKVCEDRSNKPLTRQVHNGLLLIRNKRQSKQDDVIDGKIEVLEKYRMMIQNLENDRDKLKERVKTMKGTVYGLKSLFDKIRLKEKIYCSEKKIKILNLAIKEITEIYELVFREYENVIYGIVEQKKNEPITIDQFIH